MLIGPGFGKLEQRITDALCSGRLRLIESTFLQHISQKIEVYLDRAALSPAQANWLYTILTKYEQRATSREIPSNERPPALSGRPLHLRQRRTQLN